MPSSSDHEVIHRDPLAWAQLMHGSQKLPPIRRKDLRRGYLRAHPLEVTIALGSFFTAICLFIFSSILEVTSVGRATPDAWELMWNAMYFLGATAILVGLSRLRPRWEASGFVLLGACYLVDALAVGDIRGFDDALISVVTFAALGSGCMIKGLTVQRATRIVEGVASRGS